MILAPIRGFVRTLLDFFYPCVCVSCGKSLFAYGMSGLCPACEKKVEYIDNRCCGYCGTSAGDFASLGRGCTRCRPHEQHFTRATGVVRYTDPVRMLVHDYKFKGNRGLGGMFARQMVERLEDSGFPANFDLVLAVPLHKKRYQKRGYNQSEVLARHIARSIGVKYDNRVIYRTRNTVAQSLVAVSERSENIAGAFSVDADLWGKTVLLVDDVLTTGTTASECARVLREAGARCVYVCVWAR